MGLAAIHRIEVNPPATASESQQQPVEPGKLTVGYSDPFADTGAPQSFPFMENAQNLFGIQVTKSLDEDIGQLTQSLFLPGRLQFAGNCVRIQQFCNLHDLHFLTGWQTGNGPTTKTARFIVGPCQELTCFGEQSGRSYHPCGDRRR